MLVSWLHSLHVAKTRGFVQHAVHPKSVSPRGTGLVSIDVCGPRACRALRLIVIDRSCANSPVCCRLTTPWSAPAHSKTASSICGGFLPKTRWYALYSLSFSGLAQSIAVRFKIRPRLCFGTVLCHLVVIFLPILACTFCLAISSRGVQWCHFKSCPIAFNCLRENP